VWCTLAKWRRQSGSTDIVFVPYHVGLGLVLSDVKGLKEVGSMRKMEVSS
jgi:hypothetical protein